jgi:hypothetical protein
VELNSDSDNSAEIIEHHLLPSFPRLSQGFRFALS